MRSRICGVRSTSLTTLCAVAGRVGHSQLRWLTRSFRRRVSASAYSPLIEGKRINGMRKFLIAAVSLMALSSSAQAEDANDFTPVPKCEDISYSASISVFSRQDAVGFCRSMEKVLEGVRVQDIRTFEKAW
jgi:hypothetical protein